MKATSVMKEREKLTMQLREGWTLQSERMVWMMREINHFKNEKSKSCGVLKMIKVEVRGIENTFKCLQMPIKDTKSMLHLLKWSPLMQASLSSSL